MTAPVAGLRLAQRQGQERPPFREVGEAWYVYWTLWQDGRMLAWGDDRAIRKLVHKIAPNINAWSHDSTIAGPLQYEEYVAVDNAGSPVELTAPQMGDTFDGVLLILDNGPR